MPIDPSVSGLASMVSTTIAVMERLDYRLSSMGSPHVSSGHRNYGPFVPVVREYGALHTQMLTFEKPGALVQISLSAGRKIWNRHTLEQYEPQSANVGVYAPRPHPRPWPMQHMDVNDCAEVERFILEQG